MPCPTNFGRLKNRKHGLRLSPPPNPQPQSFKHIPHQSMRQRLSFIVEIYLHIVTPKDNLISTNFMLETATSIDHAVLRIGMLGCIECGQDISLGLARHGLGVAEVEGMRGIDGDEVAPVDGCGELKRAVEIDGGGEILGLDGGFGVGWSLQDWVAGWDGG